MGRFERNLMLGYAPMLSVPAVFDSNAYRQKVAEAYVWGAITRETQELLLSAVNSGLIRAMVLETRELTPNEQEQAMKVNEGLNTILDFHLERSNGHVYVNQGEGASGLF